MAYNDRGLAYFFGNGNYTNAIADFTSAVEINPDYLEAYNNRGLVRLMGTGEYEKAIEDFSKAIELNANFANPYCGLGLTYKALNKKTEAITNLEKCLALSRDPTLTETAQTALNELKQPEAVTPQ